MQQHPQVGTDRALTYLELHSYLKKCPGAEEPRNLASCPPEPDKRVVATMAVEDMTNMSRLAKEQRFTYGPLLE